MLFRTRRGSSTSHRRARHPQRKPARLKLEVLEDRLTPATYTWTGGAGGGDLTWDNPNNWNPVGVPGEADDAVFDGTSMENSTVITPFTVGNLRVTAAYTGILSLTAGLLVKGTNSSQAGGIIRGPEALGIDNKAAFTWTGGVMDGGLSLVVFSTAILNISGTAEKTFAGFEIGSTGLINWTGTGNITLANDAEIQTQGTFNAGPGPLGSITGQGLVSVGVPGNFYADASSVFIDVPFETRGCVVIPDGRTLTLNRGSDNFGTSEYDVGTGGRLGLDGVLAAPGITWFDNGASVTGAGVTELVGGRMVISSGDVFVSNFQHSTVGIVDGTGTLRVDTYEWLGGPMEGAGITRIGFDMPQRNGSMNITAKFLP